MSLNIQYGYDPDDLPRLYEIEKACFTPVFRWSKKDFVQALKTQLLWVGEHEEQIAGFVICEISSGTGHIVTVDVAPEFRRRGFGEALMGAAECHCRKAGIKKMELEVHPDNPAQTMYFKMGYRVYGIKERYYANGSRAVSMVKTLKKVG